MIKTPNNQEAQITQVEINLPAYIQIDLVQANELRHYEFALWIGSLFGSAAASFWTACLTASTGAFLLLWVSIVFSLFTIVFMWMAKYFRSKLKIGGVKKTTTLDSFK